MPFMIVMRAAGDGRGDRLGHRRRTGVVVFAGEERHLALPRVDPLDLLARVPVEAVVVHVPGVDARPALRVVPPVLALRDLGARRCVEPERVARAELAAMDRRVMEEVVVAPRRVRRRLEADDAGQLALVVGGDLERDRAAHRAAHHHRPLELERLPHRADELEVALRRQPVPREPPLVGRRRTPVIRQVERDDAEPPRDLGVVQHVPPLPAVGARSVQAEERDTLSRLLEEDPVARAERAHLDVAADDRFVLRHFGLLTRA